MGNIEADLEGHRLDTSRHRGARRHLAGGAVMKRIYVAGAFSADNVLEVLDNMRRGMRVGLEVLLAGYAPFVPWFDYHFQLMLRDGEKLEVHHYYDYSMTWLEVSDAILLIPNSEHSRGTQTELKRAEELGIPIFNSIDEIKIHEWRKL